MTRPGASGRSGAPTADPNSLHAARPPRSSFSPRATIMSASSASRRWSLSASPIGAVIQMASPSEERH
jgi:hypothetical protein